MKAGWEVKPLGEVCNLVGGGTPSKKAKGYYGGSIPWVTVRDMNVETIEITDHTITEVGLKNSSSKIIPKGEIIIASRVGLGKVCKLADDMAINQDLKGVIPKRGSEIDRQFLFYWFQSVASFIEENGVGATVQGVKLSFLNALPFPMVPLEEQKRLVAVLDAAFEGLTRAKENAEANLQNAQDLFESSVGALLSRRLGDARLVPLAEVANLDRGHNPPKSDFVYEPRAGYVRFYQIRDRKSDKHAVYVPETSKLHRVEPHEVLMTAYRHIGEVFRGADGAFNVALCKLSSKSEVELLNDFLFAMIPTEYVKGELLRYSERSLIPSMSIKHLETIKIPVPEVRMQETVVSELDRLDAEMVSLETQYQTKLNDIADLRQSLLQKAFAGELT